MALDSAFCLRGVIVLWRRRRPMAVGILFTAILPGTHIEMHFATQLAG